MFRASPSAWILPVAQWAALQSSENSDVLYLSPVEVRNDIPTKMKVRSKYRRNRRNMKTRYRKARWVQRRNSIKTGRFSPTMRSKFDTHLKEIAFVSSILPISRQILETGTFDPHALTVNTASSPFTETSFNLPHLETR